uniref:Mfa1 family fimbria major subunit n=1 Tax=Prevotella sp. TaxID=59823 RepID=UPI003FF007A1
MKKTLLFSVALAGLMLGSCSSSDDLNGGGNTGSNQSGNGYVAFNIHLPSQSGSSSRANDDFKDGMKSEYDVKDATLLVFEGADEANAQFKGAYKLNTAPWTDKDANENITTTSATVVKQIDTPVSASNCYALVVLNNNGVFTVDELNKKITLAGASTAFTGTYDEFAKNLSDKDLTSKGFYMANAPLADAPGGSNPITSVNVKTLVNLDGKIKESESAAKSAPAQIFVERGVAKVTMQKTSTPAIVDGSKKSDGTSTVDFKITSWALDNTNKKTYLVRSTDGFGDWANLASNSTSVLADKYRFVGSNAVATGLYRTYFAKDANYTATENENAITAKDLVTSATPSFESTFGDENPIYCFENTFDVASQLDKFTTRVLIKAELNSKQTFYVINGDENTIFDKTEVEKEIKKYFLTEYKSWIQTHVTGTTSVNEGNLNVTISDNAGAVTITSIEFTGGASATTMPTDYQTTVMNRIGTIQEYKNGEAYYFVRIKHFGDDLTPWKNNETPLPSTSSVYPTDNQAGNYLGRYGVLRNNWYDISVTGVKGLGSSTVPDVTTDTDDELKSYIAVQINVLSWAKRTQGAVLH